MSISTASALKPARVHETLARHLLADGYPIVLDLERSHGAFLYDARSDREILDFFGSFSTVPLGYNHARFEDPELREALLRAAVNKPANSDLYTVEMARFVERFAGTLPQELQHHLFFIDGGALAVENALKAAFDWKKNLAAGRGAIGNQVIHFREAFHGRTGYTLSVTNTDPAKTLYFPKFDWPRISNPKLRFPVTAEVLTEVETAEALAVEEIEHALAANANDVAAILVEPIQGEGGDNHFRAEFLHQLRRLADEHEVLLVFDEVQTGFGTTGRWWSCEHFDVVPDIIAFGKKTQTCGIAAGPRLDEVDSVFQVSSRINSTWGGNLVDMIRSRAIVEVIEQDDLLKQVTDTGEALLRGLWQLAERFEGHLSNVRGRGFFAAFDLPDGETRQRALEAFFDEQLLGLASGTHSIRFRPPLIVDEDLVAEGLGRIERGLQRVLG